MVSGRTELSPMIHQGYGHTMFGSPKGEPGENLQEILLFTPETSPLGEPQAKP